MLPLLVVSSFLFCLCPPLLGLSSLSFLSFLLLFLFPFFLSLLFPFLFGFLPPCCLFTFFCSFPSIKLEILLLANMVIMERSRSPIRPPSSGNEPRLLVGFPVWTRPMGSGTQVPPPRQYPSNFSWSQQGQGTNALPEVPVSQQSMMIPPGQPGLSQQALDLSQPSATPVPSWQPPRAPMATPRHTQYVVWLE